MVSKVDTGLQSNKEAKFNANATQSFLSQGISHIVGWNSDELFVYTLMGHNYRAAFDVSPSPGKLSTNRQRSRRIDSDLQGQEIKLGMIRKKQVEGWQPLKCLLTSVGRQWVR